MKYFIPIILVFSFTYLNAQIQDDFEDGDFSNNPSWVGSTNDFMINAANNLQLNATRAGTSYLSITNNRIDETEWNFWVEMQFAPSDNNYLKIYLVSDQQDLTQPLNGYFIKIGENGSDDGIDLYRQDSTNETLLHNGIAGRASYSTNKLRIKVFRKNNGEWKIWVDTLGNHNYVLEGKSTDKTYSSTKYFGFFCEYTSTRSDKFLFDDIYVGSKFKDTIPPIVDNIDILNDSSVKLTFSEPVQKFSAENQLNYLLAETSENPKIANFNSMTKNEVTLSFPSPFINDNTFHIIVQNILDTAGNSVSSDTSVFYFLMGEKALPDDIVISEILPDPDPPVNLPDAEFAELYNKSNRFISLNNWTFEDPSTKAKLKNIILKPDSFLILCSSSDAALFMKYGRVMGLSSMPSLNNTEDDLTLKDSTGEKIYELHYFDDWYRDDSKSDGGWSLEIIDPDNVCSESENWIASEDPNGGTPGQRNSVDAPNPDIIAPSVTGVKIESDTALVISFDEKIDSASATQTSHYKISNSNLVVSKAYPVMPDLKEATLLFNHPIEKSIIYEIMISGIEDCSGNKSEAQTFKFGKPEIPLSQDIVINEILFNPQTGGSDFVELYNNSSKIFDLKDVLMANKDENGDIDSEEIIDKTLFFLPSEYLVITENKSDIEKRYNVPFPSKMVEIKNLPAYPDKEGDVIIKTKKGSIIDEVAYAESWHFALLDNEEGVSLERIKPSGPSQSASNWQSAASTVGFATPTYQNSQYYTSKNGQKDIWLSSDVFSPDQDGYQDFLEINFNFGKPGYVLNAYIYDIHGRKIKNLLQNELLGVGGAYKWDGVKDDGQKANVGVYILYLKVFDLDGNTKKYKLSFTLAGPY